MLDEGTELGQIRANRTRGVLCALQVEVVVWGLRVLEELSVVVENLCHDLVLHTPVIGASGKVETLIGGSYSEVWTRETEGDAPLRGQ